MAQGICIYRVSVYPRVLDQVLHERGVSLPDSGSGDFPGGDEGLVLDNSVRIVFSIHCLPALDDEEI